MVEVSAQLQAEIEKYEQKHAENPEGRSFVPLANAYRKAGDLPRAERLLRTGLARYPDYLSAHIVLGRTLTEAGAHAEAAAEFRHVLSIDPQNLIALRTLGDLAADAGRSDEAEYWYRELLAVDPMNEDARRALAELASAAEVLDEPALTARWQRPAHEPEGGLESVELASETLAELYARQGFTEQAAEMYRELIRRRGEEPALVRRLAELEGRHVEDETDADEEEPAPAAPPPWLAALDLDEPGPEEAEVAPQPAAGGDEAFTESFRFGFEGETVAEAAPDAEAPAAEQSGEGGDEVRGGEQTVAQYFAALLGWRQAAEGTAHPAPPPAAAGPAAAGAPVAAGEDEEPFPWELPAPPQHSAPEPNSTWPAAPAVPEPESTPTPPARAAEEDDDDLESFQAWLRSLKR